MSTGDFRGNQANERPGTAVSNGQMDDNDEDSLDQCARNSPAPLPWDSSIQLAEDSPVQFAGSKTFSRVSVSSSILSYENGPRVQDNEPSMQRAAIAEMRCGISNASGQIGYSKTNLRQQLPPTVDQLNGITDEQAHNEISLDRGQERRGEQYVTPASSESSHQRRDSLMPGRRTTANTPAPSAESARSSSERPALQMEIVDLTNSDDDSPLPANNRPKIQTTTDSDEEDREELAETQNNRLMLKKEMEDLVLKRKETLLQKRINRRARRAIKSEPSGTVKSEQ